MWYSRYCKEVKTIEIEIPKSVLKEIHQTNIDKNYLIFHCDISNSLISESYSTNQELKRKITTLQKYSITDIFRIR